MRQAWHDVLRPVSTWLPTYCDARDADAFRRWLRLILDPRRRFDVGEGFGFSPLALRFGLLTYRYVKLFTDVGLSLYRDPALATLEGIEREFDERTIVDFMIRTENLELDLISALRQAGYTVDDKMARSILAARQTRTNSSARLHVGHYFDEEAIQLVATKEACIIQRHGYSPPM